MSNLLMLQNIVRDRSFIFWQLAFPIIMVTLFSLAFSGLIHPESVQFDIAVASDNANLPIYRAIPLFNVVEMTADEAKQALENDHLSAYIDVDNSITIAQNGTAETVINAIVNQIEQVKQLDIDYFKFNPTKNYLNNAKKGADYFAFYIPFYALIAMNATYAAFASLEVGTHYTANLSAVGQRVEMAPLKKLFLHGQAILMAIVINFITNIVAILYVKFILRLPIFDRLGPSLIMILALNFFGAALGSLINTTRLTYQVKNALIVVSSLLLSFLSGMMIVLIRTLILKHAPILAKINPISLATTALFRLNMLNDSSGYYQIVEAIMAVAAMLFVFVIFAVRRRRYVSL